MSDEGIHPDRQILDKSPNRRFFIEVSELSFDFGAPAHYYSIGAWGTVMCVMEPKGSIEEMVA
jgi:hypothetical protein